jgi:hypothetical protein
MEMGDMDQLQLHLNRNEDAEHRFNSKSRNIYQSSSLITHTKHYNNIASIHPVNVHLLTV